MREALRPRRRLVGHKRGQAILLSTVPYLVKPFLMEQVAQPTERLWSKVTQVGPNEDTYRPQVSVIVNDAPRLTRRPLTRRQVAFERQLSFAGIHQDVRRLEPHLRRRNPQQNRWLTG